MGSLIEQKGIVPVRTALWKVGAKPERLPESTLAKGLALGFALGRSSPGRHRWQLSGRRLFGGHGTGAHVDVGFNSFRTR